MEPGIGTIKAHSVEFATFQLKVHGADEHTINHVRQSILTWVEAAYRNGQLDSYEAFSKKTTEQYAAPEKILPGAGNSVL